MSSNQSSFSKFFRQVLSPARKSSTPSPSSSPVRCDNSDDIHQVFNYFDENGDGKITATELQNCLKTVSDNEHQLSDEEAEMAVRSSDADGDGVLGLDDFAKMMKESEIDELKDAFVMYSKKSSKDMKECVITAESLKKMLRRLGQMVSVSDCKKMIGRFDGNGDGVLDFDEFKVMMS